MGKSKAKFFRAFGFTEHTVDALERGLLTIAQTEPVKKILSSQYGTKYIIEGSLKAPSGVVVRVRTVWIIEPGNPKPRFVTAHPV